MALFALAAGASLIGTALGINESRKARKSGQKAQALTAKRAAITNIQNRRAAAAAIRRQQALQRVAALSNGMGGSSGDSATAGSIESQGLSAAATHAQQIELGGEINSTVAQSQRYSNRASNYSAFASLAGQVGSLANSLRPAPTVPTPSLPEQL